MTTGAHVVVSDISFDRMRLSVLPFLLPAPFQLNLSIDKVQLVLQNVAVTTTCDNVMQLRASAMQLGVNMVSLQLIWAICCLANLEWVMT